MHDEIKLAEVESIPTAVIRNRLPPRELPRFIQAACGEVWSFARSRNCQSPDATSLCISMQMDRSKSARRFRRHLPATIESTARRCLRAAWRPRLTSVLTSTSLQRIRPSINGAMSTDIGARRSPGRSTAIGTRAGTQIQRRSGRIFSICWRIEKVANGKTVASLPPICSFGRSLLAPA